MHQWKCHTGNFSGGLLFFCPFSESKVCLYYFLKRFNSWWKFLFLLLVGGVKFSHFPGSKEVFCYKLKTLSFISDVDQYNLNRKNIMIILIILRMSTEVITVLLLLASPMESVLKILTKWKENRNSVLLFYVVGSYNRVIQLYVPYSAHTASRQHWLKEEVTMVFVSWFVYIQLSFNISHHLVLCKNKLEIDR